MRDMPGAGGRSIPEMEGRKISSRCVPVGRIGLETAEGGLLEIVGGNKRQIALFVVDDARRIRKSRVCGL